MLKNYLKVAFRTISRNRLISFINIFGLGLSMSVGMMIMIRLQDQFSYDNFHPQPERTYRILTDFHKKTGERWKMASTPLPLLGKLGNISGIDQSVSIYPAFGGKATGGGKEMNISCAFTEPSFFRVFGFTLYSGNPETCLSRPDGIVLSKATAEKFFGKESALGKIITREGGKNFIVTGVLSEIPGKSHIDFDVFISITAVPQLEKDKLLPEQSSAWYHFNTAYTYCTLKKGYFAATINKEINFIAADLNKNNDEGSTLFELQNIKKITPGSNYLYNDIGRGGSWGKLYTEIAIAFIILLAAAFNYTNLTIARALTRAKEVGVRKINGAARSEIFAQYIIESVLVSLFALCFAWVLLSFIIQYAPFNDGYEFIPSSFNPDNKFIVATILFALFTGLLAGTSPAWILSSFKPLRILRNMATAKIMGRVSIQKSLIVFQYTLSLTIIIFLLAFYRQFSHLAKADPGFKRDNVLVVPINGIDKNIAMQKVKALPGVQSASAMSSVLWGRYSGLNMPAWVSNKSDASSLNYYYADPAFIRDMKLSVIAGTNFPSEADEEKYILLNEQAVKSVGFKSNQQALGQKLWINDSTQLQVTGVLKDFHYMTSGIPVMPLAIRSKQNAYSFLYLIINSHSKKELSARVTETLNQFAPSETFNPLWLDDQLEKNNSQAATISLLGYLAFMAIAIASLGLLGLVIYTVEVKRKEISIRKTIGAETNQLVKLLSKGFVKLLFVSGAIAIPIGYTISYLFLMNFADRVSFGAGSVLFCFSILLIIGLTTIISQTYKAAIQNPVKFLRNE
ncbi:MAG: ABC transporter permease [Chitinophagaceae bacterium]